MNSCIYRGHVWHTRKAPIEHGFSYPMLMAGFDLSELSSLSSLCRGFSVNRKNFMALHESDYLEGDSTDLLVAAKSWFVSPRPERVVLITMPRVYSYVFNPISLFMGFDSNDQLIQVVVQVNNTFGDRHIYPLTNLIEEEGVYLARCAKEFHVSPFFDIQGEYRFLFKHSENGLEVHCDYYEGEKCLLFSGFKLNSIPLTKNAALLSSLQFPFRVAMTMPRIVWQAFKLHYMKKLKVYGRPEVSSKNSIKSRGSTLNH